MRQIRCCACRRFLNTAEVQFWSCTAQPAPRSRGRLGRYRRTVSWPCPRCFAGVTPGTASAEPPAPVFQHAKRRAAPAGRPAIPGRAQSCDQGPASERHADPARLSGPVIRLPGTPQQRIPLTCDEPAGGHQSRVLPRPAFRAARVRTRLGGRLEPAVRGPAHRLDRVQHHRDRVLLPPAGRPRGQRVCAAEAVDAGGVRGGGLPAHGPDRDHDRQAPARPAGGPAGRPPGGPGRRLSGRCCSCWSSRP